MTCLTRPHVTVLTCGFLVGLSAADIRAADMWRDAEGNAASLDMTFKGTAVGSHAPHNPELYPERDVLEGTGRLRFGMDARLGDRATARLDYEHRTRWISENTGPAAFSFEESDPPYRIHPLDGELAESRSDFTYHHELDRALIAVHPDWGQVLVGRQAIGLGRGLFFGAVDVFTPFSPLEVDREWRRGVDAIRLETRLSETSSAELLAAFGESWDASALLGRLRGYLGNLDAEFVVGRRARDTMLGIVLSGALADAEIHGELAVFDTDETQPDPGLFDNKHIVEKAVLGSSYAFNVGEGLTLSGEYHYSGFGSDDSKALLERLATDPLFRERYLRGDMQIPGRHAFALQLSYPFTEAVNTSLLALQNPVDGSGVVTPSVSWDFAECTSLIASAFLPWGSTPSGARLTSTYGGTPISLYLQVSLYY